MKSDGTGLICGAHHPNVVAVTYTVRVTCTRYANHRGHHIAAPYGKVVMWIEPEKTRGAAKLVSDDAQVISRSDRRTRPGWWRRLIAWLTGA